MAESPFLTIFSNSPTFSDNNLAFEFVDKTNSFAVSSAEHNYQKQSGKGSNMIRTKKTPHLKLTALRKQIEGAVKTMSLVLCRAKSTKTHPKEKGKKPSQQVSYDINFFIGNDTHYMS